MTRITRIVRAIAVLLLATAVVAPLASCLAGPATGESVSEPRELRVSAASSLKDVLEKTAPAFEEEHGVTIIFNFGASGLLQKQAEGGAPVDAFVSASPAQVRMLVAERLIQVGSTSTFAGNDLVVLVPVSNPKHITGPADLGNAERLVTGNPETAPHGTKAREWLNRLGLWDELRPRFVFAENAAQTLDYVVRGEVDAGIGFGSEAALNDKVEVAYTVPGDEITPVRYVAASLIQAAEPQLADAYVAFLSSSTVQLALTDAGFLPAPTK